MTEQQSSGPIERRFYRYTETDTAREIGSATGSRLFDRVLSFLTGSPGDIGTAVVYDDTNDPDGDMRRRMDNFFEREVEDKFAQMHRGQMRLPGALSSQVLKAAIAERLGDPGTYGCIGDKDGERNIVRAGDLVEVTYVGISPEDKRALID